MVTVLAAMIFELVPPSVTFAMKLIVPLLPVE
jgi:hypothetical protein